MDVAFIVLSYNHPNLTARAVSSILEQHNGPLICVHNGSEKIGVEQLKKQFPQVEHLVLEKNKGYSGGANAGLKRAFELCPWALFLTNDCEIKNLPQIPEGPCVVAPQTLKNNFVKIDSLGGGFEPASGFLFHCQSKTQFTTLKKFSFAKPYIPGSAFLAHRDVFNSVGGFDERLGTYWEDVDWSQRVIQKNFKLKIDGDWLVRHGGGKTCYKYPLYTLYYFQRNRKKVSWKYAKTREKIPLAMSLSKSWASLAFKLARQGRHRDIPYLLKAIWD